MINKKNGSIVLFFVLFCFSLTEKIMSSWLEPGVIKKQINKHRKFAYWKAVSFRQASTHFHFDREPSFLVKPSDSGAMNLPERTHWQLSWNDIALPRQLWYKQSHVSYKQMLNML